MGEIQKAIPGSDSSGEIITIAGFSLKVTEELLEFLYWIESTSLFHSIKQNSGNSNVTIMAMTPEETMSLQLNNKVIYRSSELPLPLLKKFWDNYPVRLRKEINLQTLIPYGEITNQNKEAESDSGNP